MYWEGPCPEWIRQCHRTVFAHAQDVRLLGPDDFDELRTEDRDIDLRSLHVAHRSDFIRAYLLAKYGGLWIDSDCVVMQSLQPLYWSLRHADFFCHRERQGTISNAFMGASPGSQVAAALYARICSLLRSKRPLGWITLGGEALQSVVSVTKVRRLELPCETIQPICWSQPEAFFALRTAEEHERRLNPKAVCYMLANQSIQRHMSTHPTADLMGSATFFRFLVERALRNAASQSSEVFQRIYRERAWGASESASGWGSSMEQTAELRHALPLLLAQLGVQSILDVPCGDFHWMQHVDLGVEEYIGGDIVPELIEEARHRYARPGRRFLLMDLCHQELPRADLILCRDALVHLSFADIASALRNFRRSGSSYLLTTTFPLRTANTDIATGQWRTLNLQLPPFHFPPPLRIVLEKCSESGGAYADKSLGLWRISDLPL